jgi:hypothetical protein
VATRTETNEIVDYTECTGVNYELYELSPINRIQTCELTEYAEIGLFTQVSDLILFSFYSFIFQSSLLVH